MRMSVTSTSIIATVIAFTGWTAHIRPSRAQQLGRGQDKVQRQQPGQAQTPAQGRRSARTTKEELDRWMTELSNWGRWGKDDQLGAVNTITPTKRKQAGALVKTGTAVSLAHDLITETASDVQNPYVLNMTIISPEGQFAQDRIDIAFHGGTVTHLDALCHVAYNGKFYNGFDFKTVSKDGCS